MDPEIHPEYTDAYVAALPLADCQPVRGDRKQRLGKGKQAKTFKSAFFRTTAAGHEEVRAKTKRHTQRTLRAAAAGRQEGVSSGFRVFGLGT